MIQHRQLILSAFTVQLQTFILRSVRLLSLRSMPGPAHEELRKYEDLGRLGG